MTERLEKITEHHERALSAKDEGEARLRNKAIRARSWTVKGPDIKGEAMVLPTEDWDYLIDKGVELAVALAEVERLRAASAKLALECATQHEEIERLRGVVEAAKKRVSGSHAMGCSAYSTSATSSCDCGRDELRAALAELEKP